MYSAISFFHFQLVISSNGLTFAPLLLVFHILSSLYSANPFTVSRYFWRG